MPSFNRGEGISMTARTQRERGRRWRGQRAFSATIGQSASGKQSFKGLIEACSGTLVKIMNTTAEAGEISRRAIGGSRT
jgi:hypothetical protein